MCYNSDSCSCSGDEYGRNSPASLAFDSAASSPGNEESLVSPSRRLGRRSRDENRVRRPMNAFMVWAKVARKRLAKENPTVHNAQLSKMLGELWRDMPEDEKQPHLDAAESIRKQHRRDHPDYKYQPRRRKSPQELTPVDGKPAGALSIPQSQKRSASCADLSQCGEGGRKSPRYEGDMSPASSAGVYHTSGNGSSVSSPEGDRAVEAFFAGALHSAALHSAAEFSANFVRDAWSPYGSSLNLSTANSDTKCTVATTTTSSCPAVSSVMTSTQVQQQSTAPSTIPTEMQLHSSCRNVSSADQLLSEIDVSVWENDAVMKTVARATDEHIMDTYMKTYLSGGIVPSLFPFESQQSWCGQSVPQVTLSSYNGIDSNFTCLPIY